MITDEERWKIEQIIKRCSGACQIGSILHRLWSEYEREIKLRKKAEKELWEKVKKGGKGA